jgi:4-azaleucine resistance transporter AzlC
LPLALGNVPFGLAYGVAARQAGLDPLPAMALSVLVFAGSAQFIGVGMIGAGAGGLAVVATTLVVNLRHLLFGAAVAPALRGLPAGLRAALAFGLTDETFAVSQGALRKGAGWPHLAGSELALFGIWQAACLAGVLAGQAFADPASLGFDLVFPLAMLAVLLASTSTRSGWAAAAVGGLLALAVSVVVPGHGYVLAAGVIGGLAGALREGSSR